MRASEIARVDVHGNATLHYLAGSASLDLELIRWLRTRSGGDVV